MKATSFPREYRAFDLDKKEMLYSKDLINRGFSLMPDGLPSNTKEPLFNIVLCWYSGQVDHKKTKIFEGDICKIDIKNEFGSLTVDYGIMRWNQQAQSFMLLIPSSGISRMLNVAKVEKLGNEFENEELLPLVNNKPLNG
jgi:hypothetical protein